MNDSAAARLVHFSPLEMEKRSNLRLERASGDRNRLAETASLTLWFECAKLGAQPSGHELELLRQVVASGRYTGFVANCDTQASVLELLPTSASLVVDCDSLAQFETLVDGQRVALRGRGVAIVCSQDTSVLRRAKELGAAGCLRAFVDDGESLQRAVASAVEHGYLLVAFRDPTNIPLELFIATLQAARTVLIKAIADRRDVDDAIVTLGVMEVGAEGVMFSPESEEILGAFVERLQAQRSSALKLASGTVTVSRPAGMGYRSCIDVATIFSATEGLLVGSTSQGGLLCCSEVFFLPYMEPRPFRVNAGGVHCYVYGFDDRTDYMTELRSGSQVMIVDKSGRTRRACVGRMKTELRPLRLIEVVFEGGERVSTLMQDDWHVRVFSPEGAPLNITELEAGTQVLGYLTEPGRHVGIKVNEHILET